MKGLHFLIDAAEIMSKVRSLNFVVIGDGPEYDNYVRDVKARGLDSCIRFVGWLGDEELLLFYQTADIYCLPSMQEGLPQSLLESMCVGIPSIASSVGGIPDLIKDGVNGFLIEPGNVDQLVRVLTHLLENPEQGRNIGEKGRDTILSNYTWDATCNRIVHVIKGDS